MKNILVPTDFSENADKALDFALALAHKFNATLHIIHAYSSTGKAGHLANLDRVIKEDREIEMAKFMESTKASISFDIQLSGRCRKGEPNEVIADEVENVEADLVVMGTLGASNLGKKLMGSTASNLIKNIFTPVLAIPTAVEYTDLENMIVALDAQSMAIPRTLNPMIELAQKLGLSIHLVHVSSDKLHTEIDPTIKDYLTSFSISFSYNKIQSNDVLGSVIGFANDKGNSLLCMISHQRSWFENLFHSSVSQQLALKSNLPLLILHDSTSA